ncbi:MAG TPA: TonB-dependent receptor plug domain-containing protein [Longimicrobium sp.]|nr:TonB-dependent receptor plug domain-containing protein [Longimicrobium sp.]
MRADQPAAHAWQAPLDQAVTLRTGELSLRDALDRLSAAAKVRLSYSAELLPLDRRVCVAITRKPLGDALAALVGGAGAQPVAIGGQVVLAPAPPSSPAPAGSVTARESVLERIVATGSPAGAARRPLTIGLGVVEGEDLADRSVVSMAEVMNGTVPGVWIWQRSPSSLLSQYGSVRGASSFGATYPKVYLDGVETANPLALSQIDPEFVERVEVIRGPQGAALYGSDAISGVVNIVTRHEGSNRGTPRLELRSEGGVAASDFSATAVPTHRQHLVLRAGNNLRSLGLALGYGGTGGVYRGSQTRQLSALAAGRLVGARSILTTTLRYYDQSAGAGSNPLLAGFAQTPPPPADTTQQRPQWSPPPADSADQSLREYTGGATLRLAPGGRWTFTMLAGLDGYRLNHLADTTEPFPSALADPLQRSRGGADRGTLRASATTRLGAGAPLTADVTFAVEHAVLHEIYTDRAVRMPEGGEGRPGGGGPWPEEVLTQVSTWRNDTGILGQAAASWHNSAFVTGGLRLERNTALYGGELSVLPMLGAAWVQSVGAAEVKVRGAYGRGIRPAAVPARDNLYAGEHHRGFAATLQPEAQAGTELGVEVYLHRTFSLQVTRFDQRATGLVQNVVLRLDTLGHEGEPYRRAHYQLQNVGEITNRGWEMEGSLRQGPLSLTGALSLVDSRVRHTAQDYAGELRPGDRVLGVPAGTFGLTTRWDAGGWYGALTASRAWDWIGYDRLAQAEAFTSRETRQELLYGAGLRDFWRTYHGSTDLRATLSREVGRGVRITATGANLLGSQLGEPDNVTIRAGRTLTLAIRTSF